MNDDAHDRDLVVGRQRTDPVGDRADELRRAAAPSLADATLPPLDRAAARVDRRSEQQRADRQRYEFERKASLLYSVTLNMDQARKQYGDAELEEHQFWDDLQQSVGTRDLSPRGQSRDVNDPVVRAFHPQEFQNLYEKEKLLALREAEALFSKVERRSKVDVEAITMKEAAARGWEATDIASYDHEQKVILLREDLLREKDVRQLLRPFFQMQKYAEQHEFLGQHVDGTNVRSDADAERAEMLQDAIKQYPPNKLTETNREAYHSNPREVEAREHARKQLEAYDRIQE